MLGLGPLEQPSSSAPPIFGCLVPPAAVGKHKDRPVIWRLSRRRGWFWRRRIATTTRRTISRAILVALCQRCHLAQDRGEHQRRRRLTLLQRKAIGDLFLGAYSG